MYVNDINSALTILLFTEKLDKSLNMAQIGLDSLMAAEVKQNLYRNFKLELKPSEIRNMTFEDFSKINNC